VEMKVCINCLPLMKAVWFWCTRLGSKGCNLVARIFVIIFGIMESTLIGRKLDTVWMFFFWIMVMYA
jgi:hypothetical protein